MEGKSISFEGFDRMRQGEIEAHIRSFVARSDPSLSGERQALVRDTLLTAAAEYFRDPSHTADSLTKQLIARGISRVVDGSDGTYSENLSTLMGKIDAVSSAAFSDAQMTTEQVLTDFEKLTTQRTTLASAPYSPEFAARFDRAAESSFLNLQNQIAQHTLGLRSHVYSMFETDSGKMPEAARREIEKIDSLLQKVLIEPSAEKPYINILKVELEKPPAERNTEAVTFALAQLDTIEDGDGKTLKQRLLALLGEEATESSLLATPTQELTALLESIK
ncbi:MAG: hypothetical protein MRY21_08265 [Simkaniaceae bacterium]|nr:hypothetical protein [Simkaniaceae bacterium]